VVGLNNLLVRSGEIKSDSYGEKSYIKCAESFGGDGGNPSGGGGAGGGGSGGLIFLHTDTLSEQTPTYNVSGGSGGKGSGSKGYKSGDGADGADGEVIKAVQ
jgi:hypothetical protein